MTSADGTRLAVCRDGRGEPLVPVHGSAGGLDSWDPVPATMAALPAESRVVLDGHAHVATHTAPERFAEAPRW